MASVSQGRALIGLTLLFYLAHMIVCDPIVVDVVFKYKSNVDLDCSQFGDEQVTFYKVEEKNDTAENSQQERVVVQSVKDKIRIEKNVLHITDLRKEEMTANYICETKDKKQIQFINKIVPHLFKPEKQSQTVTEGGSVELECVLLYGDVTKDKDIAWTWSHGNETELDASRVTIVPDAKSGNLSSTSKLIIKNVNEADKGTYTCGVSNKYGEHSETLQLRVKNTLSALWPFLAIVVEVIILCVIILVYEKKCGKKPQTSDEDNEQAQNLMGRESDAKKRSVKA